MRDDKKKRVYKGSERRRKEMKEKEQLRRNTA